MKESYGTLAETISGLMGEGYTLDFNNRNENLMFLQDSVALSAEDFRIDKLYRFEGASNPDDASILYAISSSRFNVKGLLVNGYGIYSDAESDALIADLNTHIQ